MELGFIPAESLGCPYSPLFKYSWKTVYPALLEAAE
jgi:gentisate 1,2-dioxygenase